MLANRLFSLGRVWYNLDRDYTCAGWDRAEQDKAPNRTLAHTPHLAVYPPYMRYSAAEMCLDHFIYIRKKEQNDRTNE